MQGTASFYDELAEYYKLIYPDWEASVIRQAEALDAVIKKYFGESSEKVLDAACGIGTQAIGLAQLGFSVSASDISPAELDRAKAYASERNLEIDFRQADMRNVDQIFSGRFDLIIACDNSVPHLLTDENIVSAFVAFRSLLNDEGGVIISIRDYAEMELGGKQIHPRIVRDETDHRLIMFDVWDFEDDQYTITLYIIEEREGGSPRIKSIRGGRYYCITIDRMEQLFLEADFREVHVLRDAFFQPLLVARKSV